MIPGMPSGGFSGSSSSGASGSDSFSSGYGDLGSINFGVKNEKTKAEAPGYAVYAALAVVLILGVLFLKGR